LAPGTVEITETGPGGQIQYHEAGNRIRFDWEFGGGSTIALIFGPRASGWDSLYPWASGRQAEIFAFVGSEIIRQKAPNAGCEFDLDTGDMSIGPKSRGEPASATGSPAFRQILAAMPPAAQAWAEGESYDLAAIAGLAPAERDDLTARLAARTVTWREVEALAALDTPAAWAAVEAAVADHLSIDTRVAAALLLHRHGRLPDLDRVLASEIRLLDRPAQGMDRTLRAAAQYPGDRVKQALLWASLNGTDCAPHCAALLLDLTGSAAPFAAPIRGMLDRLGRHNSYFDRQAAFEALCALVGMELDQGQGS
jgi:hypothetical protein